MCDCKNETEFGGWLGRVGGQIGDRAQKTFRSWTGLGDYQIHTNSLIEGGGGLHSQMRLTTQGREVRIAFREYLGEIVTGPVAGQFNSVAFDVNPGDIRCFPWLAPIAAQYEQYKPMGMIFEFKSTATDTSITASLGSVIMAADYDVTDKPFTSKQEMLNSAYSSEGKLSDNQMHGIECAPTDRPLPIFYVRPTGRSVGKGSLRDYDLCRFQVATQGGALAPNQSVGSLYVHYDFIFYKETPFGGLSANELLYAAFKNTNTATATNTWQALGMTQIAGHDLGWKVGFNSGGGANGILIPKNLAGAVVKFQCYYTTVPIAPFTLVEPVLAVPIACAELTPDVPGINWVNSSMLVPVPGVSAAQSYIEAYFKIDDQALTNAVWYYTSNGYLSSGPIGQQCVVQLTIVPKSYWEPI